MADLQPDARLCTGICRLFHRLGEKWKERKYLLKTQSFPHSPQICPQEFSTGWDGCGYSFLVHIIRCDTLREFSHFFAGRGFYHGKIFVQKFGLDKPGCAGGQSVTDIAGDCHTIGGHSVRSCGSGFFTDGWKQSAVHAPPKQKKIEKGG